MLNTNPKIFSKMELKNKNGWTWEAWLTAAGLYHTLKPQVENVERYQKLTKAWENCENPYKYKE